MRRLVLPCLALLVVFLVSGVFAGCGGKDDGNGEKHRDTMPFLRIKLKNPAAKTGVPATATAQGKQAGRPSQSHQVGPVAPGEERDSDPPGTMPADSVTVSVSLEGGPTFTGSGSWPGTSIDHVDIDAPGGAWTATVEFATPGKAPESLVLNP